MGGVSGEQRAVELAYRAVARRERTVSEIRTYLGRKEAEPAAIDHAVAELQAAGLLDDARFAERFAEDKRLLEHWGSERIARDLRLRGVAEDLVDAVVASRQRVDELQSALELLGRRVPTPPPDDRGRDRAWRMLVRKGYAPELAYEALRAHRGQNVV